MQQTVLEELLFLSDSGGSVWRVDKELSAPHRLCDEWDVCFDALHVRRWKEFSSQRISVAYASTAASGELYRLDLSRNGPTELTFVGAVDPPMSLSGIVVDDDGVLWAASWDVLWRFDETSVGQYRVRCGLSSGMDAWSGRLFTANHTSEVPGLNVIDTSIEKCSRNDLFVRTIPSQAFRVQRDGVMTEPLTAELVPFGVYVESVGQDPDAAQIWLAWSRKNGAWGDYSPRVTSSSISDISGWLCGDGDSIPAALHYPSAVERSSVDGYPQPMGNHWEQLSGIVRIGGRTVVCSHTTGRQLFDAGDSSRRLRGFGAGVKCIQRVVTVE